MTLIPGARRMIALLCIITTPALAADEPTLEFSWKGIVSCRTLSGNPTFTIRNPPPQARRVRLFLIEGPREMGGQEIELPQSGIVPAGTIYTYSPCNAGYYRWTAVFKTSAGQILGQARQSRFYPTDEILPEK